MKSFNNITKQILLLAAILLFIVQADAQCKRYTKKYCLPSLAPFINNGKLNSAIFTPGETADLEVAFNAGKTYRILVCSQDLIGKVQFKVLDKSRKVLFESDEDETNPYWDFKVTNTQQLIIQIKVPEMDDQRNKLAQFTPNGCVSILIGVKP